jgi:DNA-binding NarL/FixJ family response regulator
LIRILLADDHQLVREGLRSLLEAGPDFRIVGEAGDAAGLFQELSKNAADVVVLDISMPGPGVIGVLRRLGSLHPRIRTVILSMRPEEDFALRCFQAGAMGYVTKDRSPEDLAEAIRRVHRGLRYVSIDFADRLLRGLGSGDAGRLPHEVLSAREFEVMCHLGAGRALKEIAALLGVSPKTVSTYRARVLEKMGFATTADIIRYVMENDLGA